MALLKIYKDLQLDVFTYRKDHFLYFEINHRTPSPNQWSSYDSRWRYYVTRDDYHNLFADYIAYLDYDFDLHNGRSAHLMIETHRNRSLDPDNLNGGLKPIIDAMRRNGFFIDDNKGSFSYNIHEVIESKANFTRYEIIYGDTILEDT